VWEVPKANSRNYLRTLAIAVEDENSEILELMLTKW